MDLLDEEAKHDTHTKDLHSLDPASGPSSKSLIASPEQNGIHGAAVLSEVDAESEAKTESLCVPGPRGEREGEESEREETESSDDNTTQYSIHPPQDCPYLLLLQGCSLAQVFDQTAHSEAPLSTHLFLDIFRNGDFFPAALPHRGRKTWILKTFLF